MKALQGRAVFWMIISSLSFSLMQICVKFIEDLPLFEIIFFRSVVAITITLAGLRTAKVSPWGHNKKLLWLRGIAGLIALTLFFETLRHVPLASAITVQYSSPIFTTILAVIFLKERVRPLQGLFFLLAFGGVAMIKGFDPKVSTLYLGLGLGSAFFAGIAYTVISKLRHAEHPLVLVFYFHFVALPVAGLLMYADFQWPSLRDSLLLVGMGVAAQGGQYFMTRGLQAGEANRIISIKYVGILFAVSFGFLFFGELPNEYTALGTVLVLVGVLGNIGLKQLRTTK